MTDKQIIYLDNAASTPVIEEVIDEMIPYLGNLFGNPSSVHQFGRKSKLAIQRSRKKVADLIGAKPNEIFFTSGGTESDNLALKGLSKFYRDKDKNHIITSVMEHDAILETCRELESDGFDVTYLEVGREGIVNPETIKKFLSKRTILVSIMLVNNEVGTIQPIGELAEIAHEYNKNIIFHTDAVQGVGKIPIDINNLNVDSLSISSHKINGPKGVGALYVRNEIGFKPLIHGGGQEYGLRSGTENVHGIIGFGKACEISLKNLKKNCDFLTNLRNYLIEKILSEVSGSRLNGSVDKRIPSNTNFTFFGINGEDLIIKLDEYGILASTGSACSINKKKASHVLKAMGLDHEEISGSVRFSIGIQNTKEELDKTIDILLKRVEELREISPFKSKYSL
jgi:cysteine desulfurase